MGLLDKLFGKPKPINYKYNLETFIPISDPISEDEYWAIISTSLKLTGNFDEQYKVLIEGLKILSPEEIAGFKLQTNVLLNKAYFSELWCAASIINGGCSFEEFEYFRVWLISRGKEVFYQSIQNPDSIIEFIDPKIFEYDFEMFLYASDIAFEETTGKQLYDFISENDNNTIYTFDINFNWEEDDPESMKAICPKLFEKYFMIN